MLKRKISVAVMGILLGAQVGLAAAAESAIPLDDTAIVANGEPHVKSTYQSEHAGSVAVAGSTWEAFRSTYMFSPSVQRVRSIVPSRNSARRPSH